MEAASPLNSDDAAQLALFADAFDDQCGQLYLRHVLMNIAAEERRQRLTLWDAEEDVRYEMRVSAHEAFVVVLAAWKNDAAKRAYTQRLMELYYNNVAIGSAKQAEIDVRRARLAEQTRV